MKLAATKHTMVISAKRLQAVYANRLSHTPKIDSTQIKLTKK